MPNKQCQSTKGIQNAQETARTCWGSLSIPPDPLAAVKGLGPPEREEERGGEGKEWIGEEREGEGGRGWKAIEKGWDGREREGREEGTGRGPQVKTTPSSDTGLMKFKNSNDLDQWPGLVHFSSIYPDSKGRVMVPLCRLADTCTQSVLTLL